MTERQHVEYTYGLERPHPFLVLAHFGLDGRQVCANVVVPMHHAHGLSRGARSVNDFDHVLRCHGGGLERFAPGKRSECRDRQLRNVDSLERYCIACHYQARLYFALNPPNQVARRPKIDRDYMNAPRDAAPKRTDPLRTVFGPQDCPVALSHARLIQVLGKCRNIAVKLGIRESPGAKSVRKAQGLSSPQTAELGKHFEESLHLKEC